jgi:hypothetical protein
MTQLSTDNSELSGDICDPDTEKMGGIPPNKAWMRMKTTISRCRLSVFVRLNFFVAHQEFGRSGTDTNLSLL